MKLEIDNLTDEQQDRMCELCELHIIGGRHNTYHYQCEGSHCDKAFDYLLEDVDNEDYDALPEEEPNEQTIESNMKQEINWDEVPIGTRFTATIDSVETKGKIQKQNGSIFLCQNLKDGEECGDMLGYEFSWCIGCGTYDELEVHSVGTLVIHYPQSKRILIEETITPSTNNDYRYLLIRQ